MVGDIDPLMDSREAHTRAHARTHARTHAHTHTHTLTHTLTNAHVNFSLNSCLMQWSVVPVVPGVGVSSMLEQDRDHLSMAEGTGIVQGNEPTWKGREDGGEGRGERGGVERERDIQVKDIVQGLR